MHLGSDMCLALEIYGFDAHSLVLDPKPGKAYYGKKQLDWSISKLPFVQLNRGAVLSWLTRGVHLCDDLPLDTPICGALSSLSAWTWNVETLLFIFDNPLKLHSSWRFRHYPEQAMCVFFVVWAWYIGVVWNCLDMLSKLTLHSSWPIWPLASLVLSALHSEHWTKVEVVLNVLTCYDYYTISQDLYIQKTHRAPFEASFCTTCTAW